MLTFLTKSKGTKIIVDLVFRKESQLLPDVNTTVGVWSNLAYCTAITFLPRDSWALTCLGKHYTSMDYLKTLCQWHSSYLSQPPQPAVVYFFSAGVLFRIMNAKFWPILSHCDQVRLYFRECKHFLVYFLQAHIMWWCIKIDKYGVCLDAIRNFGKMSWKS